MRQTVAALLCLVLTLASASAQSPRHKRLPPKRAQTQGEKPLSQAEIDKLEGWRAASINSELVVLYNRDRISLVPPDIKRAWLKTYLKPTPAEKYRYALEQHDFNCATREQRIVFVAQYRSDGTVFQESQSPDDPWSPIPPGTVADELFEIVCEGKQSVDDLMDTVKKWKVAEANYKQGQQYEHAGKYADALRSYEQALQNDPRNPTYKWAIDRVKSLIK